MIYLYVYLLIGWIYGVILGSQVFYQTIEDTHEDYQGGRLDLDYEMLLEAKPHLFYIGIAALCCFIAIVGPLVLPYQIYTSIRDYVKGVYVRYKLRKSMRDLKNTLKKHMTPEQTEKFDDLFGKINEHIQQR